MKLNDGDYVMFGKTLAIVIDSLPDWRNLTLIEELTPKKVKYAIGTNELKKLSKNEALLYNL